MKFRPILFSTDMVQAILDGTKTQTRRVLKPQPNEKFKEYPTIDFCDFSNNEWHNIYASFEDENEFHNVISPLGKEGDILRIIEKKGGSNIYLQIKDIRVNRLQDISEEDAVSEGVIKLQNGSYRNYHDKKSESNYMFSSSAIPSFQTLWSSTKGEESWYSNPWVWVIEFERIEKPKSF